MFYSQIKELQLEMVEEKDFFMCIEKIKIAAFEASYGLFKKMLESGKPLPI